MTGTFRVAVPFCDLIGCYLMVILLLGSIVAINVAFMIAPEEVTNFFCELGVGENASKQARLYAAEANNDTGSQPSDESSGMLRVSARSDKSIFDIEEPELGDDEPIPRRIGIDPVEQSSLTHSASEVTLPDFVKAGFTARERCSTDEHTLTQQKEPAMNGMIRQFTKPVASSPPYLERDDSFDTVWYALPTIDRPSAEDDQSGSFLDRTMLRHLSARRTIWFRPTSSSDATTTQDLSMQALHRYAIRETRSTTRTTATKRRVLRDRLKVMMAAAFSTRPAFIPAAPGAANHTTTVHNAISTSPKPTWFTTSTEPANVRRKADTLSGSDFTSDWVRVLVVPKPEFRNYSFF
ncbi:hypothetical protein MRX96_051904 [Rhipicephalus microplus]